MHCSDTKVSTIIHDRALFLCASLVSQDHASGVATLRLVNYGQLMLYGLVAFVF